MKTKIISVILAIVILSALPTALCASAINVDVTPCWNNTDIVSCKISFADDGYGYAEAFVLGNPEVTKIKAHIYVYVQNGDSWDFVNQAHEEGTRYYLDANCQFTPTSGAYYKAIFTLIVTKKGVEETIKDTVYNTAP